MNLKPLIAILVILLLFPVIAMLWPQAPTTQDVRNAFEQQGLTVTGYSSVEPPALDAVEHATMMVEEARVNVYRYEDEGKIARNYGEQQSGEGEGLSMLRQQLGAAEPTIFTAAARNGKLMMTATSGNKVLNRRLLNIFNEL